MEITFTKGAGKYDKMEVLRSGTVAQSIDCPKQGIIPHDMVHYAVESILHKRGFIARILDGEAATPQMEADSETNSVERLVEVFQADGWSGWSSSPDDMLDLYRVTCGARECPVLALSVADVEAVRGRILELTESWKSIAVGQSLTLRFHD